MAVLHQNEISLRKSLGRRGWISQYLPRFGGARIQSGGIGYSSSLMMIMLMVMMIIEVSPITKEVATKERKSQMLAIFNFFLQLQLLEGLERV